jgi:hypothetical protein
MAFFINVIFVIVVLFTITLHLLLTPEKKTIV